LIELEEEGTISQSYVFSSQPSQLSTNSNSHGGDNNFSSENDEFLEFKNGDKVSFFNNSNNFNQHKSDEKVDNNDNKNLFFSQNDGDFLRNQIGKNNQKSDKNGKNEKIEFKIEKKLNKISGKSNEIIGNTPYNTTPSLPAIPKNSSDGVEYYLSQQNHQNSHINQISNLNLQNPQNPQISSFFAPKPINLDSNLTQAHHINVSPHSGQGNVSFSVKRPLSSVSLGASSSSSTPTSQENHINDPNRSYGGRNNEKNGTLTNVLNVEKEKDFEKIEKILEKIEKNIFCNFSKTDSKNELKNSAEKLLFNLNNMGQDLDNAVIPVPKAQIISPNKQEYISLDLLSQYRDYFEKNKKNYYQNYFQPLFQKQEKINKDIIFNHFFEIYLQKLNPKIDPKIDPNSIESINSFNMNRSPHTQFPDTPHKLIPRPYINTQPHTNQNKNVEKKIEKNNTSLTENEREEIIQAKLDRRFILLYELNRIRSAINSVENDGGNIDNEIEVGEDQFDDKIDETVNKNDNFSSLKKSILKMHFKNENIDNLAPDHNSLPSPVRQQRVVRFDNVLQIIGSCSGDINGNVGSSGNKIVQFPSPYSGMKKTYQLQDGDINGGVIGDDEDWESGTDL